MAGRAGVVAATVVDASAIAALLFVEPDADRLARAIEGQDLYAPSLLPYELASVAQKKLAAHPAQGDRLLDALARAGQLGIHLVDVDPVDAVRVARETRLTTYDASYLVLAWALEAPLTTLDVRLRSASARRSRGQA